MYCPIVAESADLASFVDAKLLIFSPSNTQLSIVLTCKVTQQLWPAVCTHSYRQYIRIMLVVPGHTPLLLGIWPRIESCTSLNLAVLSF